MTIEDKIREIIEKHYHTEVEDAWYLDEELAIEELTEYVKQLLNEDNK